MRTAVRSQIGSLLSDGRGWILSSIALGWFLLYGMLLVLPVLLPSIKTEFGIDNTTGGAIITTVWVCYAGMGIPSGLGVDRWGERTLLLASIAVSIASLLLLATSPGFVTFVVAVAVLGAGIGIYPTPRSLVLSNVFGETEGLAFGVTSAVGNVGTAVLPFVAGIIAARGDWRMGMWLFVPLFVAVAVGLHRYIPAQAVEESVVPDRTPKDFLEHLVGAVTEPAILRIGTALVLMVFIYQGFTTFLTTYLESVKHVDHSVAVVLFSLFFASGALFQVFAGHSADVYGRSHTLTAVAVASGVALFAFPLLDGVVALGLAVAVISLKLSTWPLSFAYLAAALPPDIEGVGYGLVRTVYVAVGSSGAIVVGVLADSGLFGESFQLLGVATVLTAGLYLTLPPLE